jgi:phage terminase small subunit
MFANKQRKNARPNRRDLERYRRFVEAYLDISNPRSYLKAKPSAILAGYSKSYAHGRSYELLDKVGIQNEMKRVRDARLNSSTIATPVEILESISQQLRMLPNALVGEDGELIPIHQLSRDQAAAIANFKDTKRIIKSGKNVITETRREYRLIDRLKAAEMLAKYHGLFKRERKQQTPPDNPVKLVAMPCGEMTLAEWTRQVEELNAAKAKAKEAAMAEASR